MSAPPSGSGAGGGGPRVREPMTEKELNRLWADPPGLWGQLTAVQNDTIGARLLLTGSSSCCWAAASTRC